MASKKKATKKAAFRPKQGDVVAFSSRRGWFDGVIVATRMIQKGRSAGQTEFTLALLDNRSEKRFYFRCRVVHLQPCKKRYTKKQIAAATEEQKSIRDQRETSKYKRTLKEQNALYELGELNVGDKVLVNFSDGKTWRVIGDINHRTGKIGVRRFNTDEIVEWNRAKRYDHSHDLMAQIMGLKPRQRRPLRWLESSLVLKVDKAA